MPQAKHVVVITALALVVLTLTAAIQPHAQVEAEPGIHQVYLARAQLITLGMAQVVQVMLAHRLQAVTILIALVPLVILGMARVVLQTYKLAQIPHAAAIKPYQA